MNNNNNKNKKPSLASVASVASVAAKEKAKNSSEQRKEMLADAICDLMSTTIKMPVKPAEDLKLDVNSLIVRT